MVAALDSRVKAVVGQVPAISGKSSPVGPVPLRGKALEDAIKRARTGQREMDDKGLPEKSEWAAKYSCAPRRKPEEIVDTKAGYVYDSTRQNPPNPAWGLPPWPGKAQIHVYPDCKDGRIVADVVRLDKGHTEGLEPKITEALVKLMLSAKGGKLQQAR